MVDIGYYIAWYINEMRTPLIRTRIESPIYTVYRVTQVWHFYASSLYRTDVHWLRGKIREACILRRGGLDKKNIYTHIVGSK